MDALNDVLPVILYAVLIILIVVLIIFVIKALSTVKKINSTIDNVNNKIAKLDKAVSIVDGAADYISIVSDKVVGIISTLITSVFKRKNRDFTFTYTLSHFIFTGSICRWLHPAGGNMDVIRSLERLDGIF